MKDPWQLHVDNKKAAFLLKTQAAILPYLSSFQLIVGLELIKVRHSRAY